MKYAVGMDIGSTSAKVCVIDPAGRRSYVLRPTGWDAVHCAEDLGAEVTRMKSIAFDEMVVVATGYGRISVPFAAASMTEISCHAKGAEVLFCIDATVIDVACQDTKVIRLEQGRVVDFLMNDKCSAGTGRFLEVMANSLGVDLPALFALAAQGKGVSISSMCTVFAESEVIGLIGAGINKADIAFGIVESVVSKVVPLAQRERNTHYLLSGGLCESPYIVARLAEQLEAPVETNPEMRYAGAIGAALFAREKDIQ